MTCLGQPSPGTPDRPLKKSALDLLMWNMLLPSLDRFLGDLSYCLRLLIGFDAIEVDHGGRLPAMGGMRPPVVVECDPVADGCLACNPVSHA